MCSPVLGASLLPVLAEPTLSVNDAVFSEIENPGWLSTMIRTLQHKMVINQNGDILQFFDMQQDPKALTNLAGHSEQREIEGTLREQLLAWHLRTDSTRTSGQ